MKKVIISIGTPTGCGPRITLDAIKQINNKEIKFIVVGDEKILNKYSNFKSIKKRITLIDLKTPGIEKINPGVISKFSGETSLNYLNAALKIMQTQKIKRLVTAPVSKEEIQLSLSNFTGHTEYLAWHFKIKHVDMLMFSEKVKILLATRHLLLRDVSSVFKKNNLYKTVVLLYKSLQKSFRIESPKIAFASFNPHAGIDTFLEKEEKIIIAAIKKSKLPIIGPFPSDTLFTEKNIKKYDCILCCYHDQGMIPFKLLAMKTGVNVTLGLPIIRTCPAHGVAFDLMKKGETPFDSSMVEAIKLAINLE